MGQHQMGLSISPSHEFWIQDVGFHHFWTSTVILSYLKHQCPAPWFWHIIPDKYLNVRSLFILWGIWNLIPCKFGTICYKRCLHNTPYVNLLVDFPSREYTNESVALPQYFNINQNSFQDQSSFLQIHFTHIKY